jgi:tetratricopeptide (TPR) repeat protein
MRQFRWRNLFRASVSGAVLGLGSLALPSSAVAQVVGHSCVQICNTPTDCRPCNDGGNSSPAYRQAVPRPPTPYEQAYAQYNAGNALMSNGRYAEAEPYFRSAIAWSPGMALAHEELGIALFRLNRLGEAEPELRSATELDPRSDHAWEFLAQVLGNLGRYDEAKVAEQRMAALNGQNRQDVGKVSARITAQEHNSLVDRIEAAMAAGRYDEAAALARQLIALEPSSFTSHQALTEALFKLGQSDAALAEARIAYQLDPNHTKPQLAADLMQIATAVADTNLTAGHTETALALYEESLALNPSDDGTQAYVQICLTSLYEKAKETNDLAARERWARETVRTDPSDWNAYARLGGTLLDKGDLQGAKAAYRQSINLSPDPASLARQIGGGYLTASHFRDAVEMFQAALDHIPPDNHDDVGATYTMIGLAYEKGKVLDQAEMAMRKGTEQAPHQALTHALLARVLLAEDKLDEASAENARALQLDPSDQDASAQAPKIQAALEAQGRDDLNDQRFSQVAMENHTGRTLTLYVDGRDACEALMNLTCVTEVKGRRHVLEAKSGDTVISRYAGQVAAGEVYNFIVQGQ